MSEETKPIETEKKSHHGHTILTIGIIISLALSVFSIIEIYTVNAGLIATTTDVASIKALLTPQNTTSGVTSTGKTVGNYEVTTEPVCTNSGKPSVYFFGTSWCPHCQFLHPQFGNATAKFGDTIDVHAWYQIDLTAPTATDSALYTKYNPQGSIPTVIVGCKYYRIGTVHETDGKPQLEEQELRAIICKLTNNQPASACSDVQTLVNQIG